MAGLRFGTWFWITAVENVLMHLFSSPLFWLGVSNGFLILALIMWRLCHVERNWLMNAWRASENLVQAHQRLIGEYGDQCERLEVCYAVMEKAYLLAHDGYVGYGEALTTELRINDEQAAELANYKAMVSNANERILERDAQLALVRDELQQLQLMVVNAEGSR